MDGWVEWGGADQGYLLDHEEANGKARSRPSHGGPACLAVTVPHLQQQLALDTIKDIVVCEKTNGLFKSRISNLDAREGLGYVFLHSPDYTEQMKSLFKEAATQQLALECRITFQVCTAGREGHDAAGGRWAIRQAGW